MQVLYVRCAGLDVHKDTIVACVRCISPPMHQEVRSFGATTTELVPLADWLAEHQCTHVAMGGHRYLLETDVARAGAAVRARAGQRRSHSLGLPCASGPPTCTPRFLCIKAQRGGKKAILAVAASMLTAAYHMLRDGVEYDDLGAEFLDRQDRTKTIRRLLKRLEDLRYDVPLGSHAT